MSGEGAERPLTPFPHEAVIAEYHCFAQPTRVAVFTGEGALQRAGDFVREGIGAVLREQNTLFGGQYVIPADDAPVTDFVYAAEAFHRAAGVDGSPWALVRQVEANTDKPLYF